MKSFTLPPSHKKINGKGTFVWNRRQRYLYKVSCWFQYALWKCGINWHNTIGNECTPDFSCCIKRRTGLRGASALADPIRATENQHRTHIIAYKVPDALVAGILFDFVAYLTTKPETLVIGTKHNPAPAADAVASFLALRGRDPKTEACFDWNN